MAGDTGDHTIQGPRSGEPEARSAGDLPADDLPADAAYQADRRDPGEERAAAQVADEATFARYGAELADGVDGVLAGWVERCVVTVLEAQGVEAPADVRAEARAAGERARSDVVPRLRALLAADPDEQATGPLALLREAVRYPTEVLAAAGATPVDRDEFAVRAFPGDLFALSPAAFADVDERLHEPGIRWGAAKAYVHLARRRRPPTG